MVNQSVEQERERKTEMAVGWGGVAGGGWEMGSQSLKGSSIVISQ